MARGKSLELQGLAQRAAALHKAGNPAGAKATLAALLRLAPGHWQAINLLGVIALSESRRDQAEAYFLKAIAAAPLEIEPRLNLASSLNGRGQFTEALKHLKDAERLRPASALVQQRLGGLFTRVRDSERAIFHLARARALSPDSSRAIRAHIAAKRLVCDWSDWGADDARLRALALAGERVPPFIMLALDSTGQEQLDCAIRWGAPYVRPSTAHVSPAAPRDRSDGRLRIGYISADFHAHATSYLVVQMMEAHDRARFEVIGLSYGRDDDSPTRQRLAAAFDRFIDIKALSDRDAAQLIADLDLDVLIDLKGYTEGARPEILGYRPAPVQVNYLGFPGTMGVPFIDYVIADALVAPLDFQPYTTERLVHLPDCFQPNDANRVIDPAPVTRAGAGLPPDAFVFCSFNNAYKFGPRMFDIWANLLNAVPGSVLWLLATNDLARANLMREAVARGVAPERLIFAPKLSHSLHLRRLQLADLCLDTLPVAAFTTASDALWAGVPLLTCAGPTPAGRGAVSLLYAMGVPELVASSLEAYQATAIHLATDPQALRGLRQRIVDNRATSPLFDAVRHTRAIERAYVEMVRRYAAGEAPTPYSVPAESPQES